MEYKLYQLDLIKDNHNHFLHDCKISFDKIKSLTNSEDTTWNYNKYNIFQITYGSLNFYHLFKEFNHFIRNFIGDDRPLWFQAWLNYHTTDEILYKKLGKKIGYHFHNSPYHGYISIDPQNTITKFKNGLQIENKVGQIYIGPGNANKNLVDKDSFNHFVDIISPSLNPRITIGFDVSDEYTYSNNNAIPIL